VIGKKCPNQPKPNFSFIPLPVISMAKSVPINLNSPFVLKEIDTFIQQGCFKLVKSLTDTTN